MKKLLHERLREVRTYDDYCKAIVVGNMAPIDAISTSIADEIERYYIPRPRFEDGEPIQWGDEWVAPEYYGDDKIFTHKMFMALHKTQMEEYEQADENTPEITYDIDFFRPSDPNYRVKRPSPKVLDADGVEIKVGDMVWSKGEAKYIVTKIEDEDRIHLRRPFEDKSLVKMTARCLTHKEPDSLEKIYNDMMEHHENWDSDPNEWLEMATRLSVLIEKVD